MKNGKRYLLAAIVVLLATIVFSGLAMAETASKPITKINVKDLEIELKGSPIAYQRIDFTVEPADATEEVVWHSEDEEVAKVWTDDNGPYVMSYKPGTVTITGEAIDEDHKKTGIKASFKINFKEVPAKKIVFDTYSIRIGLKMLYGDELVNRTGNLNELLNPVVQPEDATYRSVIWTTSDSSILRVSDYGSFEARKLGKVTVTATTKGQTAVTQTAEIEGFAPPITSLKFSPDTFEVQAEEEFDPRQYLICEGGYFDYVKKVTWKSSDPEIFSVAYDEDDYEVRGIAGTKAGTAMVTVEVLNYDGSTVSASCAIKVAPIALKGLSFSQSSIILKQNQDMINLNDYLRKDPIDADLRPDDLCWESSNPQVVRVGDGYLWANGTGTAIITVFLVDNPAISASIEVTTTSIAISSVTFDRKAVTLYFIKKEGKLLDEFNDITVSLNTEPTDAYYKTITYETSNAKVAIPKTSDGKKVTIRAIGKGKCIITAYVSDGKNNFTAHIKVTVTDKGPQAKLNKKNLTLQVGKKATLVAKDTSKNVLAGKWSSSDKKIAKINKKGVVKGVAPGRCVITFKPKSKSIKSVSCVVIVK